MQKDNYGKPRTNIFISSTSQDLAKHREAIMYTILKFGGYPIVMEAFLPTDKNALQLCYNKIQETDIFIGIYAHRYGYTPNVDVYYKTIDGRMLHGDGKTSVTEMEYSWARELNLPMLLFVISDSNASGEPFSWPTQFIEGDPGKSALSRFKDKILQKHVVGFFNSPDHLASQVASGILEILITPPSPKPEFTATVSEINSQVQIIGQHMNTTDSYFLDRMDQRNTIGKLLSSKKTKMISIIGRGGVGKSALATYVLSSIESGTNTFYGHSIFHTDGIVLMSTRTTGITLEKLFIRISQLFRTNISSKIIDLWTDSSRDIKEKIVSLFRLIQSLRIILLFDNIEDILDVNGYLNDKQIDAFLQLHLTNLNNILIITTSRTPLQLPIALRRLDNRISLTDGLPQTDAVRFLQDLDSHGESKLKYEETHILNQLADLVHGLPRALEIIASILANDPFLSPTELSNKSFLFNTPQFIDKLVHENFRKIPTEALYFLETLAIFTQPVPLKAVEFILNSYIDTTQIKDIAISLIKTHQVFLNTQDKSLYLHPIDRDIIYGGLQERQLPYNVLSLHSHAADYYRGIRKPNKEWKYIQDIQPLLYEFEHRLLAKQPIRAANVISLIDRDYLMRWGFFEKIIEMRTQLLSLVPDNTSEKGMNLARLGKALWGISEYNASIEKLKKALAEFRIINDEKGEAYAKGELGNTYFDQGDLTTALSLQKEALTKEELLGDSFMVSTRLFDVGLTLLSLSNSNQSLLNEVKEHFERALVLASDSNNHKVVSNTLGGLGVVFRQLGQYKEAVEKLKEAVEVDKKTNFRPGQAANLGSIGATLLDIGKFEDSIQFSTQALVISEEIGHKRQQQTWYAGLGFANQQLGHFPEAIDHYTKSLSLAKEIGNKSDQVRRLLHISSCHIADSKAKSALERIDTASRIISDFGSKSNTIIAHLMRAECHIMLGDTDKCRDEINHIYKEYFDKITKFRDLYLLSYLFSLVNQEYPASICLEKADSLVQIKSEPHFETFYLIGLGAMSKYIFKKNNEDLQNTMKQFSQAVNVCNAKGIKILYSNRLRLCGAPNTILIIVQ